jgi:hypothetical protein
VLRSIGLSDPNRFVPTTVAEDDVPPKAYGEYPRQSGEALGHLPPEFWTVPNRFAGGWVYRHQNQILARQAQICAGKVPQIGENLEKEIRNFKNATEKEKIDVTPKKPEGISGGGK